MPGDGWLLDDVALTSCVLDAPPVPLLGDGFEGGNFSQWAGSWPP